jgi:hypothetical protein
MKNRTFFISSFLLIFFYALLFMPPAYAEDDAMAKRVSTLESRLTVLEDTQKIERLIRAYGYYFDKGLWHETTTLFSDDAVVEIAQRGVFRGKASVERLYIQLFGRGKECLGEGKLNNHLILQPIITVSPDGKTATGRARILGQIAVREGDALLQEGVYNFEYKKDGGIWKISKLHYFGDIYALIPQGLIKAAVPQSGPSKDVPPDAPPSIVYRSYPGYFVPEFPYPNPVTGKMVDVSKCNASQTKNP